MALAGALRRHRQRRQKKPEDHEMHTLAAPSCSRFEGRRDAGLPWLGRTSLSARANHTAGRGRSRLVFPCVCSGED